MKREPPHFSYVMMHWWYKKSLIYKGIYWCIINSPSKPFFIFFIFCYWVFWSVFLASHMILGSSCDARKDSGWLCLDVQIHLYMPSCYGKILLYFDLEYAMCDTCECKYVIVLYTLLRSYVCVCMHLYRYV